MTGWETTTAIANYCSPNCTETNYIVQLLHIMNNVTMDMQKSLQKVYKQHAIGRLVKLQAELRLMHILLHVQGTSMS